MVIEQTCQTMIAKPENVHWDRGAAVVLLVGFGNGGYLAPVVTSRGARVNSGGVYSRLKHNLGFSGLLQEIMEIFRKSG